MGKWASGLGPRSRRTLTHLMVSGGGTQVGPPQKCPHDDITCLSLSLEAFKTATVSNKRRQRAPSGRWVTQLPAGLAVSTHAIHAESTLMISV